MKEVIPFKQIIPYTVATENSGRFFPGQTMPRLVAFKAKRHKSNRSMFCAKYTHIEHYIIILAIWGNGGDILGGPLNFCNCRRLRLDMQNAAPDRGEPCGPLVFAQFIAGGGHRGTEIGGEPPAVLQ